MPHVLLWLIVLAGPSGETRVLIQSDPFATLAACQAWDAVPLTLRGAEVVRTESVCVPVDKLPPQIRPQRRSDT
jgi:hypothetical protein